MKYAIVALMCLISLSACTKAVSNTAPSIVEYSKAKQKAGGREVDSGACPVLTEFLQDYCVMRDQARVAQGKDPTCTRVK